jgi:hypothetical protein
MQSRQTQKNLIACDNIYYGQAIKGYWWMPWHQQAKKDAKPAKSFGELEKSIDPEISEWGNPARLIAGDL